MAQHTVNVRNYHSFTAESGSKLAFEIEKSGVDISHRCGGNARCTTCRVEFHSEEPAMGEKERNCLEEDGDLGKYRLSCQIAIDRDMDVTVLRPVRDAEYDNPGIDLEPDFSNE